MNVLDSSGWLEYFADGPNADIFAPVAEDTDALVVPTISLLEVFKCIARRRSESDALQAVAAMHQGRVTDLTAEVAVAAASLGNELGLPLADSVMLATARAHEATLWTQDTDFEGIVGVRYVETRPRG